MPDEWRASVALAREDERHPFGHRGKELRAGIYAGGCQSRDLLGDAAHRRSVTEIKGGMHRVRQHDDRPRRVDSGRVLHRRQEDATALTHTAPASGDVPAEVLDRDPEAHFRLVPFGFVQQLVGSIAEAAEPCRVGGAKEQATPSLLVGSQRGGSLESAGSNV